MQNLICRKIVSLLSKLRRASFPFGLFHFKILRTNLMKTHILENGWLFRCIVAAAKEFSVEKQGNLDHFYGPEFSLFFRKDLTLRNERRTSNSFSNGYAIPKHSLCVLEVGKILSDIGQHIFYLGDKCNNVHLLRYPFSSSSLPLLVKVPNSWVHFHEMRYLPILTLLDCKIGKWPNVWNRKCSDYLWNWIALKLSNVILL